MSRPIYDKDGNKIFEIASDKFGKSKVTEKKNGDTQTVSSYSTERNPQFDGTDFVEYARTHANTDVTYELSNGSKIHIKCGPIPQSSIQAQSYSVEFLYYDDTTGTYKSVYPTSGDSTFIAPFTNYTTHSYLVLGEDYSYWASYSSLTGRWSTGTGDYHLTTSAYNGRSKYNIEDYRAFWYNNNFVDDEEETPGGGDSTSTDNINVPDLPVDDAVSSGFIRVYEMSKEQMRDTAQKLWSANIWDLIKNWWEKPSDAIISAYQFPFKISETYYETTTTIRTGPFKLQGATGQPLKRQFYKIDCGTLDVAELFGDFSDYAPYTSASIMLYGLGERTVAINDIMDSRLHLYYYVDLLTGATVVQLHVSKNKPSPNLKSVLYQWTGQLGQQIPISSYDASSLVRTAGSLAVAIGTGVVAGTAINAGSSLAAEGQSIIASAPGAVVKEQAAVKMGNQMISDAAKISAKGNRLMSTAINQSINTVSNGLSNGSMYQVQRSGSFAGASSMLTANACYIILQRAVQNNLPVVDKVGGMNNKLFRVGDCVGLTTFSAPEVNISGATENEKVMISQILTNGIRI